jgi:hypothetical protein
MANWNNPALTSLYTDFLTELKARDTDLALQFDGTTSSNLATGTIRWNSTANRWQKWNGSSWAELTTTYALTGLSTTGNASIGGTLGVTGATTLAAATATTPATGDNSTAVATTAYVRAQAYAPLASPALTGTPTVPTAAVDTNTTQAASTAFVLGQAGSTAPVINGTAAAGTSLRYSRQDHVHPTDTTRAPLASPAFTGTALLGTATALTNAYSIGTALTPAFQIESNTANGAALSITRQTSAAANLLLQRGVSGTPVADTHALGQINFNGFDGTNYFNAALIRAVVDGTPGTGSMPGRLSFQTTPSGSTTPVERLRLDPAGQILAASLGTAALPVWSFTGDPNTGLYSPGADQVAISTNGAGRLFVDASGNVGAGVSTPLQKLHVSTGVNADAGPISIALGGSADTVRTALITKDTTTPFDLKINASQSPTVNTSIIFESRSGAERARIDSSGRLGLGVSSPVDDFHIAAVNPSIVLQETDAGTNQQYWRNRVDNNAFILEGLTDAFASPSFFFRAIRATSSEQIDRLEFATTGTERMRLDSTGRLGLGTSSPGANLDVTGTSGTYPTQQIKHSAIDTEGEFLRVARTDTANIRYHSLIARNSSSASSGNNYIQFKIHDPNISTTGQNTVLHLDGLGRVGIGTTSAGENLTVGTATATDSGSYFIGIGSSSNVARRALIEKDTDSADSFALTITSTAGTGNSAPIIFKHNAGAEACRVDTSGRLLVGTSTALANVYVAASAIGPALQIEGNTGSAAALSITRQTGAAANIILQRGVTGTPSADGHAVGQINFNGFDGTNFRNAAQITAVVDGTPGTDDMPGRLVLSTTLDGQSSPTERVRLTNTGALLVGTTSTPTGAGSGAVVAQNRVVVGSTGAGSNQVYAGEIGNITATTGTVVFKFKTTQTASVRTCFVRLAISNRNGSNTPSNQPAAEYAFQLHQTSATVCTLNGATSIFEFTYVRATHFAFADLGSGECTVTLTNPVAFASTGAYRVEVVSPAGFWTLDSVTTT